MAKTKVKSLKYFLKLIILLSAIKLRSIIEL